MPINYMTPLDSLRKLAGTGFGESDIHDPTGAAQLMALQDQRASELRQNIATGGAGAAGGANLSELQGDIASNPRNTN